MSDAHDDSHDPHASSARERLEHRVAQAREGFGAANERINARTGRNLLFAILIALVIGGVVLASLIFDKHFFIPVVVLGAGAGAVELSLAFRRGGRRTDVVPQVLASAAITCSAFFVDAWVLWSILILGIVLIVIWRALAQMAARDGRSYGDVLTDVVVGGFIPVYVSFLAAMALVLLREPDGQKWILLFIGVAIAADTGAYAAGLGFGKHPMAPRVSPKKTWEGFAGAVLAAVVAGVLFGWLLIGIPIWAGAVAGIVIMLAATFGDLGESLLKRDIGIKDMSDWLPGHGGLLDRLDSVLPSALAALGLFYILEPLVG